MVAAYSYVRFSSKKQMKGLSLARQTERAEKYITANPQLNLELDKSRSYEDLGISAYRGRNSRQGQLKAFMDAVKSGLIEPNSYLIVEHLDRVARLPFKQAARLLQDICELDINVVTLSDNTIYTKDCDLGDYIRAALAFETANRESDRKRDLAKSNWRQKRQKAVDTHKPMTSNVPNWIKPIKVQQGEKLILTGYELNEEVAPAIRYITTSFLNGRGCRLIARELNDQHVPTLRKGKYWVAKSVHQVLANPVLCGTYDHNDLTIENFYPAILEPEQFKEIGQLLIGKNNAKHRLTNKGLTAVANINWLAGLTFCKHCGSRVIRVAKASGDKLVCSDAKNGYGCDYVSLNLQSVWDVVRGVIMIRTYVAPDTKEAALVRLQAKRTETKAQIDRLVTAITSHGHSLALGTALTALEADLAATDAEIEKAASERVLAAPDRMKERLSEARELIGAEMVGRDADKLQINGLLRRLFARIDIDAQAKTLTYKWIDGIVGDERRIIN